MAAVEVDDRASADVDVPRLVALAGFVLSRLRLHPGAELSVSLADRDEMAALHERWMDLPGPTDVLSFPMDQLRAPGPGEEAAPGILGDVVICPDVAAEQGERAGHGLAGELDLLLTHGILHLLGHDHAEPDEHAVMFALQDELLEAWRAVGER